MTLTEEQREAIRAVSDLPRAIGCTRCHNYIQKNYSNQFAVLRSMIDSSDHIVEPDELIGFDLERARGLRDFLQDDCAEVGDVWGEMIAEIERLRAENEDLSKAVIDIQEERDLAQAEFRSYHRAWEEQAARVQELEEVLVEMVATNPCNIPTLCDVVHDELMCPALDGNCDFWKGCPQKNELREAARKQLQAEGKIGPDADAKPREGLYGKYRISKADGSPVDPNADYFVLRLDTDPVARRAAREYSYMTVDRKLALELQERITKYNPKMMDCINLQFFGVEKPRVWQITEERVVAVKHLIAIGCGHSGTCGAISILRTMLTEAGQ